MSGIVVLGRTRFGEQLCKRDDTLRYIPIRTRLDRVRDERDYSTRGRVGETAPGCLELRR